MSSSSLVHWITQFSLEFTSSSSTRWGETYLVVPFGEANENSVTLSCRCCVRNGPKKQGITFESRQPRNAPLVQEQFSVMVVTVFYKLLQWLCCYCNYTVYQINSNREGVTAGEGKEWERETVEKNQKCRGQKPFWITTPHNNDKLIYVGGGVGGKCSRLAGGGWRYAVAINL